MREATIEARRDAKAVWWVTGDHADGVLEDELHVELIDPPGRFGARPESFCDFDWTSSPVGIVLTHTVTPRSRLAAVKAVAELVAERSA
jgi:hypothetical protein